MSDARVGHLQRLHDITAEQLARYPSRAIGVLGIAGATGSTTTDAVYGHDINADYLASCDARIVTSSGIAFIWSRPASTVP